MTMQMTIRLNHLAVAAGSPWPDDDPEAYLRLECCLFPFCSVLLLLMLAYSVARNLASVSWIVRFTCFLP